MEEQKHSAESPGKRCFSPQIKRILARLQVINVSVPLYLKCHHIAKLANFLSSKLSGEERGETAVFEMMLINSFPDIFYEFAVVVIKKLPNYFCRDLNYSRTSRYEHLSITSLRSKRFRLVSETEDGILGFGRAIFRAVFGSRSLFFAPKPHGNACYAGYSITDMCNFQCPVKILTYFL